MFIVVCSYEADDEILPDWVCGSPVFCIILLIILIFLNNFVSVPPGIILISVESGPVLVPAGEVPLFLAISIHTVKISIKYKSNTEL